MLNAARVTCVIALGVVLSMVSALPVLAHETDQYTLPTGREFVDLGPHFNRYFFNAIQRGVDKTNQSIRSELAAGRDVAKFHTPETIAFAVNREFPYALFLIEDLDAKMTSIPMKDRWPGTLPGYKPPPSMKKYLLYPLNPFRAWNCATLNVYGVYLGTDKVGHFTDMGMHYYRTYRGYLRKGETEEQAIRRAIVVGTEKPITGEAGLLGYWTAGAYSNADLAVNYAGMLFYRNLTEPQVLKGELRPPMVERDGDYWKLAPHVRPDSDFMQWFFSAHYDEALNPSRYLPQMRDGMRKMAVQNASAILELRRDQYGNRRSQEYFRSLSRDLRTLYGADYGHRGTDDELVLIAERCFPPDEELPKDPHARDVFGRTALHRVAERGQVHLAEQLLQAGADVNAQVRSDEPLSSEWGNTPLHLAALNGRDALVRLLLENGANPRAANDRGATPLHLAVEHPQIMRVLIEAGSDPNARDRRGRTPLHWAAMGGATEALALLADAGAQLDGRDRDGCTPLHLATRTGGELAVTELARRGADLSAGDLFGVTPLHLAMKTTAIDVAEVLVNAGAELDAQDHFGCTPLHEATRRRAEGVVAMLLESGAAPTVSDGYGATPLHLASRQGDQVIARLLVSRGADVHVRAGARGTPIDEALRAGHRTLAAMLRADDTAAQPAGASEH